MCYFDCPFLGSFIVKREMPGRNGEESMKRTDELSDLGVLVQHVVERKFCTRMMNMKPDACSARPDQ